MDLALPDSPDRHRLHVNPLSGLVIYNETNLLLLGKLYQLPLDAHLTQQYPQHLESLAHTRNAERRLSLYAEMLANPDLDDSTLLFFERGVWTTWYVMCLTNARIIPDQRGGLVVSSGDHWLWQGRPPRGNAMPNVNVLGLHDVPVHRMLQIWQSPRDRIPDGRHPTRNTYLCTEPLCVKPAHMWCKPRVIPAPIVTRRGRLKLTGLPPKQVAYYDSAGRFFCDPHDHPLEPPRLRMDGSMPRTVYCPKCYILRQMALAQGTVPRDPAEFEQMERDVVDALRQINLPGI